MNKLYNATDFERGPADFYPTPPDLTRGLIDGLAQAAIAIALTKAARCAAPSAILRLAQRRRHGAMG